MQLGNRTIGLTARLGRDKMEIPAAPRNCSSCPSAPGSSGCRPSALLRLMKAHSPLLARTVALASAIALVSTAAFAVTATPAKHRKKKAAAVTAKLVAPAAVTAPAP